jgi:archaellum component FlaC
MATEKPTRPDSETDLSSSAFDAMRRRISDLEEDVEDELEDAEGTRKGFAAAINRIDCRIDDLEDRLENLEGSK